MEIRSRVYCHELELDDIRFSDLIDVCRYWQGKRHGRFAPGRSDIEPSDLASCLSRIMLVDVLSAPLGFRYRLSGTAITEMHGIELTGLSPRNLRPEEYGALIEQHYCQCVEERPPLMHLILLDVVERTRAYARLLLPLSENGKEVTMLMTIDSENRDIQKLRQFFSGHSGGTL